MTVAESFRNTAAALSRILGSQAEGESAARIIFEDVAGYDRKFLFINGDRTIEDFMQDNIDRVVAQVAEGEPVQYAVGRARFMGRDFEVSPAVLIPRPETAGLIDLICKDYATRRDLDVLDIGTGSGCIAVTLACVLPFARVKAMDLSPAALDIARSNAHTLHAAVDFEQCDILKATPPATPCYDIVASNPPYICDKEKAGMDARVLDYEPAEALFVPDSDPLLFYRVITRYAARALRPGGGLYFEINALYAEQMRALLEAEGFTEVDILRDYRGLYRYATAKQISR